MSKFRARALDSTRALPIYRSEDIPDLAEYVAINRSVSQMPTGMEKEEESERHLREAIQTRQYYGSHGASFIPIPDVTKNLPTYTKYYRQDVAMPDGLIRVSGLGTEEEHPDYDMDSEDEEWLKAQSKDRPISPSQFELMMDKLEKGSGNTVLTESEAQGLLKGNPDLVVAVYDYWLSKRLRQGHSLIPSIKTDRRDGTTGNNPYIAFRKRMEKMQTRKNRKNDEVAYMYMVKLQRELVRVCTLGKQIKDREERKHELTKLDLQIFQKRYALNDWSGNIYSQLMQEHGHREPFATKSYPTKQAQVMEEEWSPNKHKEWDTDVGHIGRHEVLYKKRKKRKHKSLLTSSEKQTTEQKEVKSSHEEPDLLQEKSEDEAPDGFFTFQRRPYVRYLNNHDGPPGLYWRRQSTHEPLAKRFRFSEAVLGGQSIGLARRRFGRGQRLIWDRVPSNSESNPGSSGEAWTNTSVADSETPVGDLSITSGDMPQDMPQDTRRRRYCSRSPSPSLPHPMYTPTVLPHIRDVVIRPPSYKPPPSAFLTPLNNGQNSAALSTFMGQPSSFFHLHEVGKWPSQKVQIRRLSSLASKPADQGRDPDKELDGNKTQERGESLDRIEAENLGLAKDTTSEIVTESPSSLTMKIRIEKHYPSVGDNKKVSFVVTPSKMPPDKSEEENCYEMQSLLHITSLEGPVSTIFDLNTSIAQSSENGYLQLFGLPKQDLALPTLFSGAAKISHSRPLTTQSTAVALRLAQLKGIDHHSSSVSSMALSPEELQTHHLSMNKGGLVSSMTGLSHAPLNVSRPRTLSSPASSSQMQPSSLGSQIHSPAILQGSKRQVVLDNGMDSSQIKQVLVGSVPLYTPAKLPRVDTTPKAPPTSEVT